MAKVISVHEYELKPGVQDADFERALHDAERRGPSIFQASPRTIFCAG